MVSDDGSSIWLTSFLELLPSDTDDGMGDVYRFDVASSTVTLLTGGLDNVWHFEVTDASTDGTILALHAISGTLGAQGVFRLDTVSGDARRVDLMLPWAPDVSKQAVGPTMSGDGRRLAYLADPEIGFPQCPHVYVWDQATSTTRLVDITESGAPGTPCVFEAEIADGGRHVVYAEDPYSTESPHVRVRLLGNNESWVVGDAASDLSISANGQRTAMLTDESTSARLRVHDHTALPGGPPDDIAQVVSDPPEGSANNPVLTGRITGDGATVVFTSPASNLVPGDDNGEIDVFARDLVVPASYVPSSPRRLMDTRVGGVTVDGLFAGIGRRGAGETLRLDVVGRAGVPATAGAVVLNVTVADPGGSGFVTVWPCDSVVPPTASNLNFVAGVTVPNVVVVPVSASGEVCVFTAESATHLIADLNGWFPTEASYVPSSPRRLMDTRVGGVTVDGLFAGIGRRGAGETLRLDVVGRAGVPATAGAVVLNVTVADPGGSGFVTVWPCDSVVPPTASNLNFVAGVTVPNVVVVPVSASGEVCVFTAESATHLIADLNGWFPTSL